MSLAKWATRAVCAVIGGAALLVSGTAPAAIVVASSGPSAAQYPAGKKIADNTRITLKAGDTITVLDGGATRVLRGAGTVSIGRRSTTRNAAFAALTRQRSSTRVRTGAVRGAGEDGKVMRPNLWYVDPAESGTMCIADPEAVRLWRADTTGAETYRVRTADGLAQTITFEPGAMLAVWNAAAMPVTDGAAFTISRSEGTKAHVQKFALLPEPPDNAEELAALLIEKGCASQVELLSASLG